MSKIDVIIASIVLAMFVVISGFLYSLQNKVSILNEEIKLKNRKIAELEQKNSQLEQSYNSCQNFIESMRNDYDRKIREYTRKLGSYRSNINKYNSISYSKEKDTCTNLKNMLDNFTKIENQGDENGNK